MATLIHADIFFFVTTIAVVLVSLALIVVLIYIAKILRDVKSITQQAKEEAILVREDIKGLRSDITREGFRLERLWTFFRTITKKHTPRSKK